MNANVDVSKASKEDIAKGLAMLQRAKEQRAKQQERIKNDPAAKAKAAERSLRLRLKNTLLLNKAKKSGIVITDAEVEAEIKRLSAAAASKK